MPSSAYGHFQKNLETVKRLQDTYEDAKKAKRIRGQKGRGAFDHITRSAVVFLVSAFEVYCEEITCECCKMLIKSAKDAEKLPHAVKKAINEYVKNDSNHVPPTHLCDEGWRNVYSDLVKQKSEFLNTPNTKNLKELFEKYLGLSDALFRTIDDIDKLDDIITFRGEITHKVKASSYVHIEIVEEYINTVTKIAISIDKSMRDHIKDSCAVKAPWNDTYEMHKG